MIPSKKKHEVFHDLSGDVEEWSHGAQDFLFLIIIVDPLFTTISLLKKNYIFKIRAALYRYRSVDFYRQQTL